ncbi:hypothetical protein [Brevundimonas sp.]
MFSSLVQQIGAALTVLVTVLALWKGDRPVRIIALVSVAAFVLSPLLQNWRDFISPQWGIAAVDLAVLATITALLLRYDRCWLIVIWGISALSLLAHVGKLVDATLFPRGYIGGLYILYFAFLAAQFAGIAEAIWRRRTAHRETTGSHPV